MAYTFLVPNIASATLTPNPTTINTQFKIAVSVNEITITLEPEIWYSGELYSGEV